MYYRVMKLGRPKGERYPRQRACRLEPEVDDALTAIAGRYKTSPSEFMRWLIGDAVDRGYVPEAAKLVRKAS